MSKILKMEVRNTFFKIQSILKLSHEEPNTKCLPLVVSNSASTDTDAL